MEGIMETEGDFKDYEETQKMMWDVIYNTDWSEWWLVIIESFHILIFCLVIMSHRAAWNVLSAVVFLSLLVVMYFAQTLNFIAAQNYSKFANEQYFDSSGLFITLVVLLPCTFNCILFIFSWLLQSWSLMVDIKVQQSRYAAKHNSYKKEE